MLYRVHPGRKRMGAHYSGRLAVHQLPVGLRFHERARLLKRPAGKMPQRCKSAGQKGHLHFVREGHKREFLADPKFLSHKGFEVADVSDCGITLMCLPLNADTALPKFKNCAKHPKADGEGFVLYYTDQCPFTYYWVPKVQQAAQQNNIPFRAIHITDKEAAQNVSAPVTTYALFRDGVFLTQGIQSDKKFLALAGVQI